MSITGNTLGRTLNHQRHPRRRSLTKLDLSHNRFGESGFAGGETRGTGLALGDARKNRTLTSLDLTAGGEALALPPDETLTVV